MKKIVNNTTINNKTMDFKLNPEGTNMETMLGANMNKAKAIYDRFMEHIDEYNKTAPPVVTEEDGKQNALDVTCMWIKTVEELEASTPDFVLALLAYQSVIVSNEVTNIILSNLNLD